ncbi:MAG: sugar ABC transporter permease [Anaerolineales bacterium]|jgi:multiple sugar transport system permease protein|nr:sugar ABC transporter permease [Anaerolineales bacterium]
MAVTVAQPERRKAKLWDKIYPYFSITVPFLVIALFTIYPVLYAVRISFYRYLLTKPKSHPFIGLDNFKEVITSYYFRTSLVNTAVFTIAVVIGVTIFGLIVAMLLNSKVRTANALKILILLPWAIPSVVGGLMWKWILNSDFGILSGILYGLGIIHQYIPFLANPTLAKLSMVIATIWKEGPLAAIFLLAGLQLIPIELYEAARIDGGGGWRIFRFVTLPLLQPIMLIVVVYETITSILVFDLIYVLTGGGPGDSTSMISWFAYAEIFKNLNLGHGVALAIIIALITLVLIMVYLRVIKSEEVIS